MAKDTKYIRKRKRKYGYAYLIDIPYTDENGEPRHFSQTVKVMEHGTDQAALLCAQRIRNDALMDISAGKLRTVYPSVGFLYSKKFELMPMAISTKAKQDSIYSQSIINYASKPIDKITTADIQTCINQFAQNHTDDGIQRLLSIWRQIYKVAAILEYQIADKTSAVVLPKSKYRPKRKSVTLQDGEFETILAALVDIGDYKAMGVYYMLQIMYFTGCRPAEALALRRSDIHDTYIDINKQIGSTYSDRQMEVPTKTVESTRHVPIPTALKPILVEMIEWSKHDLLLADEAGHARDISRISGYLCYIARKHGLNFFAYKLRHQMSTDLMSAGDPVAARDILGHTSFGMSLDYARSTDQQLYDAIHDRKLAEKQPKNNSHNQPHAATIKRYAILRFETAIRLILLTKSAF